MKDLVKQIQKNSDPQQQTEDEKPPKLPDMVTKKEVAEMLRVSRRTVNRRMDKKKNPENPLPPACYSKKGSASLWSREVILDWWEVEKTTDRNSNDADSEEEGDCE